jgi:hypothetical protein
MAARATAGATKKRTRGSKGFGMMYSRAELELGVP